MSTLTETRALRVRQVMSPQVLTVRIDKKVLIAKEIMDWANVRHVPVVDERNRLAGLLTHRDLLRAAISAYTTRVAEVEKRQHLWTIPIETVMQRDVTTIGPEATVSDAARIMRRHRFGCLPVVDGGRLVGIVTEADLLGVVERFAGGS